MTYCRENVVFVDIQYVLGNNKQIFAKEIVFMFANSVAPTQILLKPPYPYRELDVCSVKQNNFNAASINGLNWNDGVINYSEIEHILESLRNFIIIVKGYEKKKFLTKYLSKTIIINFDCVNLLELQNYRHNCIFHDKDFKRCGVLNVFKLLIHFEKHNLLFNNNI